MIQIYLPFNKNYDMNGDAVLHPTSCIFHSELSGSWELELKHPMDEIAENIVENAVIKAPTWHEKDQLFRIDKITDKTLDSISIIAYPIFFDSADELFIFDKRPTNKNGQDALNDIYAGSKYSGESNISKAETAYYINKNGMSALNGSDENSFINRWGGEPIYDNYKVIVNERTGQDRGVKAEFGFNLKSVKETIDLDGIATRIVPIGANGYMLPNNETVDSPLINAYPKVFVKMIEYSDVVLAEDSNDGDGLTKEQANAELKRLANLEFENGIDKPKVTYDVNIVDLSKTDKYKGFEELTRIHLGDDILCKIKKLGIEVCSRCIELYYDCIRKRNDRVVLGNFKKNFFNDSSDITSVASKVIDKSSETLMANRISGVINLLNTSLRAQKDISQKQNVRAILFEDLDANSPTFGALCIGTQGIQISKKRTADGTDWQWGTAIDFQSINADYMITGIVTDKNGKFYLNLDTGELKMKDGTFAGTLNGATINGGIINGTTITTDEDLRVGNNIYLNQNDNFTTKNIILAPWTNIRFIGDKKTNNYSITTRAGIDKSYSYSQAMANDSFSAFNITVVGEGGSGNLNIIPEQSTFSNDVLIMGGLTVLKDKNRLVNTKSHGNRLMNAVESTYAVFEDFGTDMTDSNGNCVVELDPIFLETVNTDYPYYCYLTPYSDDFSAIVNVSKKEQTSFMVTGTPNTRFDWRITARQLEYENVRMEVYADDSN